jgi:sucrose-phosphate synthase
MYIQLVSMHGLIRGQNIEMGRDADTGGQVRYVIELAKNLAEQPGVTQVDLFTRRLKDKRVTADYSQTFEELGPNCRIVRLPCGGGRYVRKEKLWSFLDEFIDQMISFTRRQEKPPTVVHGHYADAGYVAAEVASVFDVPFVFTGHSLGKPKLEYLESVGWTLEEANQELNIEKRIQVEQDCLSVADLVITSTRHERDDQYKNYHKDESLRFEIIPPGLDLARFFPYYEYELAPHTVDERFKQARMRMVHELRRFFFNPDKPLILSLCRPDRRKNIQALIKTYGESKELQSIANLAVFAGIRSNIEEMSDNEKEVLTDILMMLDRYDLYGKMAIPKQHDSEFDVPELYRLTASGRGVFVNSAFIELFGLTFIEASATGLPFIGTNDGGPKDIIENCECGIILDVTDQEAMTKAMLSTLTNHDQWNTMSANGINRVREHYSWDTHCKEYLKALAEVVETYEPSPTTGVSARSLGNRLENVKYMLITDIDNTLLGDDEALTNLLDLIHKERGRIAFGVASGRSLNLILEVLEKYNIHEIDVIISSVGSEIYYGRDCQPDKGWGSRLRHKWYPNRIRDALANLPYLSLQTGPGSQREFKVSYNLDDHVTPSEVMSEIHTHLDKTRSAYSLIHSHGSFVDILPHRASKGKAIRYLSQKWHLPLSNIAASGDSGNDYDMLTGQTSGIVVGNYDKELESLRENGQRCYFAEANYAAGILEGLKYYGMI